MIVQWMLYGIGTTFLLGAAAAVMEVAVRQGGKPVRGLWACAILLSLALPAIVPGLSRLAALLPFALGRGPVADGTSSPGVVVQADGFGLLDGAIAARPNVDPWVLFGWLALSAALATYLAISHRGLRRRGRQWTRSTIEGREVWVSTDMGPAVVGFLSTRIVLPRWLHEREGTDRVLALAHEEEHVKARDPQLIFSAMLVVVAMPWNPAFWWLWRRLRQAIEVDCDRRVVERGFPTRVYARLLMEVGQRRGRHQLAVAALAESHSFLERRIRLMSTTKPPRRLARSALSMVLALGCVLAACQVDQPAGPAGLTPSLTQAAIAGQAATLGLLSGRVVDEQGAGVAGARVIVLRSTRGAVTNSDGRFILTSVPVGARDVRVGGEGYSEATRPVNVVAGETATIQITLSALPAAAIQDPSSGRRSNQPPADFTGLPVVGIQPPSSARMSAATNRAPADFSGTPVVAIQAPSTARRSDQTTGSPRQASGELGFALLVSREEVEPGTTAWKVVVSGLVEGTLAWAAGLRNGDEILAVNGRQVKTAVGDLQPVAFFLSQQPGARYFLLVRRGDRQLNVDFSLGPVAN